MNNFGKSGAKFRGKRILITGVTGFVGKNICEFLVHLNAEHGLGMEIAGIGRKPFAMTGVTYYSHDVLQPFTLNLNFDYIIHAATPVTKVTDSEKEILDIIVKGTQNILDFARRAKASHFLLISSGAIYGEVPESISLIPETFKPASALTSSYAKGKQESESLALSFLAENDMVLNIARCFAFSGKHLPLDAHFAIGNFVRDALNNQPIHVIGDGSAIRSYMDVDDMVNWLLTILLHDKNDIFNVGSDQGVSIKELAYEVASQADKLDAKLDVIIESKASAGVKKNVYVPSIAKAREVLGLKLEISRESSIKKMLEFNRVKI